MNNECYWLIIFDVNFLFNLLRLNCKNGINTIKQLGKVKKPLLNFVANMYVCLYQYTYLIFKVKNKWVKNLYCSIFKYAL